MIAIDRDAVVCDLAETYGVFDMYALPASTVATLAVGLRDDSRIKKEIQKKQSGSDLSLDTILLARMVDSLAWLVWAKTEDAQKNRNRPESIFNLLLDRDNKGKEKKNDNDTPQVYNSPADFSSAWKVMGGGGIGNGTG